MNEFKFLLEKNPIDHDLAHDHYIYEEFFFSIFFNIILFSWITPFLFLNLHSWQSWNSQIFVNEIYKVGSGDLIIQLIKER